MNLNLTLSKVLEEGKTLVPVFGKNNTGMQNLGNTCYLNSVIQCLFSQSDFANKYGNGADEHILNCKKFTPDCFQCQTRKVAQGLQNGRYSKQLLAEKVEVDGKKVEDMPDEYYQDGIRPQIFKQLIGKGHSEF